MKEMLGAMVVLLAALGFSLALERVLMQKLRDVLLLRQPLIGGRGASERVWNYERSLFAPGSPDSRLVLLGLTLSAVAAWLAWLGHGAFLVLALLMFVAALAWDLWSWESVAVSRWQLAWRRGWRRSVRRIPLAQVADVHVVERRMGWGPAWLKRRLGRFLGRCYLAVELHSGKAIKLPSTGMWSAGEHVERVAKHLHRHLRVAERERRLAMQAQLRAMVRDLPLPAGAQEQALQRELSLLKAAPRRERGRSGARASPDT